MKFDASSTELAVVGTFALNCPLNWAFKTVGGRTVMFTEDDWQPPISQRGFQE